MLINYNASSTCRPPFQPALQHVLGVFSVLPCLSDLGLQTQSPAEQACALLAAHKQPFLFQQHLSRLIMHAQVLCQPRNGHIF